MSTRESEDSTLNRLIPEEAVDSENTTLAFALRATELGGAPITDGRLLFPPLVHDPQSLVAFSGGSSSDLQSWSSETLAQATDGVYIPEALTISDRGEFDVDDAGFEGLTDAVDSNVFELSVDSFLAGMSSGFSIVNGEERLEAGTSAQAIAGDGGGWLLDFLANSGAAETAPAAAGSFAFSVPAAAVVGALQTISMTGHDMDQAGTSGTDVQDLVGGGSITLDAAIAAQTMALEHAMEHAHHDDAGMAADHMALLDLFPRAGDPGVVVALNGGSWFDPDTWSTGRVPADGESVFIPEGISVVYDAQSDARLDCVGVDGELHFAVDTDTRLMVDTLLTNSNSVLTIGVEGNPVQQGVTAEIVIHRDNGKINLADDPTQLGKGVVTHGTVHIAGQDKVDHMRAEVDPGKGDNVLVFSEMPQGWEVGDKLVVAGTKLVGENMFEDEVVTIRSIYQMANGNYAVELNQTLQYDHSAPDDFGGHDFKVPIANYTRNIRIGTETDDGDYLGDGKTVPIDERGHVMFMHNGDVSVQNAEFYELGRTDKSILLDTEGGTNVSGRYALHFHRTGGEIDEPASLAEGNAVWGSRAGASCTTTPTSTSSRTPSSV